MNGHFMECPECGAEYLDVQARVWVRLVDDGTDADASRDGNHEWDDDSACACDCGWRGTVRDAERAWDENPETKEGEPA